MKKAIMTEREVLEEASPSPTNIALRKQLQDALNENKSLKNLVGDDIALFEYVKGQIAALKPYKQVKGVGPRHSAHAEHQAVLIVTDAHSEESVRKEEMEGSSEYNWDVFEARMQDSTNKCIEITTMMRQSVPVTECHVFYLGDWFCGQIHPTEMGFGTSLTLPVALPACGRVVADQVLKLASVFTKVHVWGLCGNHGRDCYDSETEILTSKGWKHIDEINQETEQVAVYVPEKDTIQYEIPKYWTVQDYVGDMVEIKSKGVDLLVTPEHKLWTKRLGSTVGGKKYTYNFEKKLANENTWSDSWMAQCAITQWEGEVVPLIVDGGERKKGFAIEPNDSWAKFFGWYVSEGCVGSRRVTISQSLKVNPKKHQEIIDVIKEIGFEPKIRDKMIRFGSVPLSNFLEKEFGRTSAEKHLPEWLKKWPKSLLSVFFEAAMKGDGHFGDKRYVNSISGQYTSTSDKLIDDIQEVCFKLGYSTKASNRYMSKVKGTKYVGTARKLSFVKRETRSMTKSKNVLYSGTIWCPSVSSGWVVVRRNGRVVISGNTAKPVTKMMADRNWDMSMYLIAREYSRAQTKNVEWHIPQSIMAVADVMGHKCLLTHGNCVKRSGPEPLFAISRMVDMEHRQRRKETEDFDLAFVGHWHDESTLHGECTICPPLIGSSQFSRYLMHQSTPPGAMLYFFTEKYGRTNMWRLYL